jgi:hypothetical protein
MTASSEPFVVRKRRSAPRPETARLDAPAPQPLQAPPDRLPVVPVPTRAARTISVAHRRLRRPRFRVWTTLNQAIAALVCWCALAGVVYALSPDAPNARVALFLALGGAIFFTLSPIIRAVTLQFAHSRLYQETVTFHAVRQALLVSVFVTGNLFLQMNRAWNVLVALLLLGAFAVIEIVLLARR